MRMKTRNPILGPVLGILKGKSISGNWDDYYFKLVPGAPCELSLLQHYEITSPADAAAVVHALTPKGTLRIDYRCHVQEQGKSLKHGHFKFEIVVGCTTPDNFEISLKLKVLNETDYRKWVAVLKAVCKTRWEAYVAACRVCERTFNALAGRTSYHCRYCGRCICGDCSPSTLRLPDEGVLPVRVCTPCYEELAPLVLDAPSRGVNRTGGNILGYGHYSHHGGASSLDCAF